jgi:hypothetical protein
MTRVLGWLGVAALALLGHVYDSDPCRMACAFLALILLAAGAPRSLRPAIVLIAILAGVLVACAGVGTLLDALPALIAGLIAWIFLRSLRRDRMPLIARAIVVMDGPAQLDDPAVAAYARRLTWLWAIFQSSLAIVAALLAVRAAGWMEWMPAFLPGPRAFGAVLPVAVAGLLLAEFAARRWLLPQAPRHALPAFVRDLVRVWPSLLGDRDIAVAGKSRDA